MRRFIVAALLILVVVPLIAVATFAINAIWFKPFSVDIFFDRVFVKLALQNPELLSMLRVLEPLGIDGHNAKLTDPSDARTIDQFAQTREELSILQRYDRGAMSDSQRLSADILEWYMQIEIAREPWLYHSYPVHQMGGIHTDLASFMSDIHVIKTPEEAEYYLARLALFPWKFARVLDNVKTRSGKGLYPPRFTVERVIDQARAFREVPAEENILYTSFRDRLDAIEYLDSATREGYLAEAAKLITDTVYPEYDTFIAYYESLLDVVTENNGVWALPDGDQYYAYQLKRMTTTDLPPEKVHTIGINEVARIEGEMKRILESLGFAGVEPAQWYLDSVNDPQFVFPNTEEGKQQALAEYQRIVEEAQPHLEQTFDKMPSSPVEVRRIPAFKEKNEAAHYFPPAMDGSRPGIFSRAFTTPPRFRSTRCAR